MPCLLMRISLQLSYAGASPLLSDRKKFPRFFRTLSSDTRYNLLRLALAREFGWKRIATLNVALDYFSAVSILKLCKNRFWLNHISSHWGPPRVRCCDKRHLEVKCWNSISSLILNVYTFTPESVSSYRGWFACHWGYYQLSNQCFLGLAITILYCLFRTSFAFYRYIFTSVNF